MRSQICTSIADEIARKSKRGLRWQRVRDDWFWTLMGLLAGLAIFSPILWDILWEVYGR